jgi:hypothetical protein
MNMGFNKSYINSDTVVSRYNQSKGYGVVRLFIAADANIVSGTLAMEVDDIMSASFSIPEAERAVNKYFERNLRKQ